MNPAKQVYVVVNPKSGKGRALKELPGVQQFFRKQGIEPEVYYTRKPSDYDGIKALLNRTDSSGLLVVMGGDGTLNDVVNSLPDQSQLPVLVLPCGSGNDFAGFWHQQATVSDILLALGSASVRSVDCGICNGKKFINGLGIGFDGWVAGKATQGSRWLPARLKYHWAILQGLFRFRSFHTNFGSSLIVAIANAPTYGGGFKIAPEADPCDGKLDFWHIKPIQRLKRPYYLDKIKKGRHKSLNGPYQHQQIEQLNIICGQKMPAHIDGEYFEDNRFVVQVIRAFAPMVSIRPIPG